MALEFIQTDQGPQKVQYDENKLTEAEKIEVQEGKDEGIITSQESEMGIKEKVIPEQEVVDEKEVETTKDGKFSIDIKGALTNVGSSASAFIQDVGSNLSAIAEFVPNKIEEISQDPKKKKNFMRGLEIINASSGIKPIGQAKSTLGAISEGLLKAEKGFIATDLAKAKIEADKLKALNTKRGVLEPAEAALLKNYSAYTEEYAKKKKEFESTFNIYGLLKKASFEKKELPTGVLSKIFQGSEAAISEIAGGAELLDAVLKRGGDTQFMSTKDQVTFKNMLGAAVKQKIVGQVKELYPVSNKDIEILLQTVGDVGTNPEALRRLVSAQMAAREIEINQRKYADKYFKEKDLGFKDSSFKDSEKELADNFRKSVNSETLIDMYGTDKDISDSGIIAAKYYQDLQPQFEDGKNPFEIFTAKRDEDQNDLILSIEEFQKNLPE